MNQLLIKEKIKDFLIEDLGTGDVTSTSLFSSCDESSGKFIAKSAGVICGLPIAQLTYDLLQPQAVKFEALVAEGSWVEAGTELARVQGSTQIILQAERVILNLMQRMSGIATTTKRAVEILQGVKLQVCDTRKTMPGLRVFDKYAVKIGGGVNHRFGLYDAVMIKDNHLLALGSVKQAVEQVRSKISHTVKIEVEVENKQDLQEAVIAHPDLIMFDNQSPQTINEWSKLVPPEIMTEISGNVTLDNLADYRNCNADYISMGALTHSVTALDISLLINTCLVST